MEVGVVRVFRDGFAPGRNRCLGIARFHESQHPYAIVLCPATVPHQGLLNRRQAWVVVGIPTPLRFDVQCVGEWFVSIGTRAPDRLFDVNTIQPGTMAAVLERHMPPLKLAVGEPVAQELDEQAEVPGLVVLDLDADPHQRLRELAEGVASDARSADESGGVELADLFGGGLVRHQAGCRYVLDGRRPALETQELDDLALGRGELTHPVLVVGRQIIDHVHEWADEIIERLLVEEVEQDDVGPVVAGGEMVDGPRAGAAERRAEEVCQLPLALVDGLPDEQIESGVEVDLLQRPDGKEAVERVVLQGDGSEQRRSGCHDGPVAVLLDGGPPPLLPFLAQTVKEVHEVLAEEQERLAPGVLPEQFDRKSLGFRGVLREPVVYPDDLGIESPAPDRQGLSGSGQRGRGRMRLPTPPP